jgi:tetratricopeptide (TPR) repeat protein
MWERYNVGGQQAMTQGKMADAENSFKMALQEAEGFGVNDARLPQTLNNLANCYRQQGKFKDAEPLYQRALEIKTKQVGPLSGDLIPVMDNYAKMLRASGREQEADKLDQKARAIFAKK